MNTEPDHSPWEQLYLTAARHGEEWRRFTTRWFFTALAFGLGMGLLLGWLTWG